MTITHGLLTEIERLVVSHLDSKPEMKNLALSSPIRRFAIQPSAYLGHFVPKSRGCVLSRSILWANRRPQGIRCKMMHWSLVAVQPCDERLCKQPSGQSSFRNALVPFSYTKEIATNMMKMGPALIVYVIVKMTELAEPRAPV